MTIKPAYHWKFERDNQALESVTRKKAAFHKIDPGKHGQFGFSVITRDLSSRVGLGAEVGEFGKKDFTIAFGMLILSTRGQKDLDIIGNRNVKGHGNWFSLREEHGKVLTFEVDENSKGKNHAIAKSSKVLVANKWCHIAIVRKGSSLKIYHDGLLVAEGETEGGGIADIKGNNEVRLGNWTRGAAKAQFEDLRVYHHACSEQQIQALLAPIGGVLKDGEVELTSADGARGIFTEDESNFLQYSSRFEKLRLGPNTGATLYKGELFSGVSQKLYSNITNIKSSKIRAFPKSLHVWRSAGEPFQGEWVIRAANGKFLGWDRTLLKASDACSKNALFKFNFNQNYGQLQLIPATDQEGLLFNIQGERLSLIVNDSESSNSAFSIQHPFDALWLSQDNKNNFSWTPIQEERTTFFRVAKFAENEGQVGDLAEGEVALYQHVQYFGKVWILSDNSSDLAGDFANLGNFFGLNNTASSLRLGPDTGVTLFANENQKVNKNKRETQIEDFVVNQPSLIKSQLGNDNISSLKIFKQISSSTLFTSITSKLSQDYRMVDDKLEDFSAYRTILKLVPGVTEIEVSATDLTKIEVEDVIYEIDEVRSVTLTPNMLNQIMITSEADGIDTPSLKFRTQEMGENERVLVAPAEELHQQISKLEDDALWNAKDAQGKLIVDQKKHNKAEVASVQNTIKRVMSSAITEKAAAINNGDTDVIDAIDASNETDTSPWAINFASAPASVSNQTSKLLTASARASTPPNTKATNAIWEEGVKQSDFERLLLESNSPAVVSTSSRPLAFGGVSALRSIGGFFRGIADGVKKAAKITIGFVNNVVNAIVDVAGQVVRFVLDTVEKVAEFVQAVIEKVVESIKQFIEFLRFLFDWEDILKTQRFIKDTINSGFDSAAEFVNSGKQPVSDAINGLQKTVSDSVDGVIKSLGVDPSEVSSKESSLPEALEWFLNKIFSSIGPGKKPLLPSPTEVLSPAGASSGALDHLKDALNNLVVMAGVTMTEGLVDTIEAFIKNPTRPELALATILNLVKELGIQALDIAEDLILAVLDTVVAGIKIFQDTLNAEINIPLISALFKLIGAGKLSIINLITILVAIPTTVTSKLIFGERPFKSAAVPKLVEAPTLDNVVISRASLVQQDETPAEADQKDEVVNAQTRQLIEGLGTVSINAGLVSGLLSAALDAIPEKIDRQGKNGTVIVEVMTLGMDWLGWFGSFPDSPDQPGGFPYLLHKHPVSKKNNPQEYWQRVVWGYRTTVLSLDTIFLASGLIGNAKGSSSTIPAGVDASGLVEFAKTMNISGTKNDSILQRLGRGSTPSMAIETVLASVDLILTSIYLAQIPKKDKPGLEVASEVIGIFPGMLSLLRLNAKGALVLGGTKAVSTIANFGMGRKLLKETVKELE